MPPSAEPPQREPAAPHALLQRRNVRLLLPILIFIAGLTIRLYGLGVYPQRHACDDEFHYLWAGTSLLESGVPTSWSRLAGAQSAWIGRLDWEGMHYQLVRPALDHPPLFSALTGIAGKLAGATPIVLRTVEGGSIKLWDAELGRIRLLSILLFCFTFWLLFDILRMSFGFAAANIGILCYGFIAHIVAHNRLLVADNLIVPLMLCGLWTTQRYLNRTMSERRFAVIVIAALTAAMLCKLVAACCAVALFALLLFAGKRREVFYPVAGVLLGIACNLVYAVVQGWGTFREVIQTHAQRYSGFDSLERLIRTQPLVGADDFNSLILLGWIAIFALALRRRPQPIIAGFIAYLFGFVFFTPSNAIYGWYALPLYPFLCLGIAFAVTETWKRPCGIAAIAVLLLLLSRGFQILFLANPDAIHVLRMVFIAPAAAVVLSPLYPRYVGLKINRGLLTVSFAICLIGELLTLIKLQATAS
ncbi:MAG: ArnT family glycosyltransferase [Candidatus Sumerlaeaceae bacterium]